MNIAHFFRRFPVQVTLVALFVYALSISHNVTLTSLTLTAKVAGWDWQPMNSQPLLWLLTLPLRLLPAGGAALGLNLFSALCGALTLGILARSLELADWDRPLGMLGRWRSKLPIVLGCVACGLEFNFWQEATAATGEMLQNLLLAAAILSLLQFRVTREFRWLQAATFIWGLGLVENWMMLVTLPLFLGALLWLGKQPLLTKNLLLRLALAGLAGFSIFIVLPLWNGLAPHSPWSFGEAWLNSLRNYKHLIGNLYSIFWRGYRMASLAAILFYLVPILPAILRTRDSGTLDKSGADQFQVWIYRSLRFAILLACLWVAFDPIVGARQIVLKQMGLSLPFLSLDYLLGLGVGFLAGNFLLALFARPENIYRPPHFLEIFFERALIPGCLLLLTVVSLGLLIRNTPAITLANRQSLDQFGELALHSLPDQGGIILSDDPQRLMVFQAAAAAHGEERRWLALNTRLLPDPVYRQRMANLYPGNWLTNLNQGALNAAGMGALLHGLALSHSIYYLHPSFNYLSDIFYLQTAGLTGELKPYENKDFNPPPLTSDIIAKNEKFWDDLSPHLEALQPGSLPKNSLLKTIYNRLHLQPVPPNQNHLLAEWYAVALDDWGVQLQRAGQLSAAKKRFEQARALNEKNIAADLNWQCNTNLSSNIRQNLGAVDALGIKAGSFTKMAGFILNYGPVDEPAFCYLLGNACYQAGLPRQSIQQFERAQALAPDSPAPQIALIKLYTHYGMTGPAQELLQRFRADLERCPATNDLDMELTLLEANLWLTQTNPAQASGTLQSLLKRHPADTHVADVVLQAYLSFGDATNALHLVNQHLAADPDNLGALFIQANLLVSLAQFTNALPVLDHALTISNLPPIRLARAVARIETGQYDAAEADYLELGKTATNSLPIDSGMAEIASRRHDTNRATEYLERCLAEMPADSPQRELISKRLNALKVPAGK